MPPFRVLVHFLPTPPAPLPSSLSLHSQFIIISHIYKRKSEKIWHRTGREEKGQGGRGWWGVLLARRPQRRTGLRIMPQLISFRSPPEPTLTQVGGAVRIQEECHRISSGLGSWVAGGWGEWGRICCSVDGARVVGEGSAWVGWFKVGWFCGSCLTW